MRFNIKGLLQIVAVVGAFLFHSLAYSQYAINGNADSISPNCFRLTEELNGKWGSVWSLNKVNIKEDFQISLSLNFGQKNSGADGIAFVIQKSSNSAGSSGIGIGYAGISPSFAVEFDTYKNGFDPEDDHYAVQINGNVNHNIAGYNVIPPQTLSDGDIEDSLDYGVFISWQAIDTTIIVLFDCDTIINLKYDISQNIFSGDSMVYWGLTSATGGKNNLHTFCHKFVSFFDKISDTSMCQADSVLLNGPEGLDILWKPSSLFSDSSSAQTYFIGDQATNISYEAQDTCGFIIRDTINIDIPNLFMHPQDDTAGICNDDSLLLNVSTGNSFVWDDGSTQSNKYASKMGKYLVTITEGSCSFVDSIYIEEITEPSWAQSDTIVCEGNNVDINLNYGFNPDSVIWDNAQNQDNQIIKVISDTNLISTYYKSAGSKSCIYIDSFNITLKTQEIISDTNINVCIGDSAILKINGSFSQHLWNNGNNNNSIIVSDSGTYSAELRDSLNCPFIAKYQLDFHPDQLSWNPNTSDASCFNNTDGSIHMNLSFASMIQLNWSNGVNTNIDSLTNLQAGKYDVTITDNNGCLRDTSFVITMPNDIAVSYTTNSPSCYGDTSGSINIHFTGGTQPYSITWNNGSIDTNINNIAAGIYNFQMLDFNQCTSSGSVSLSQPDSIKILNQSIQYLLCTGDSNASISAKASGGSAPFNYSWSNNTTDTVIYQLSSGNYSLTITDSLLCNKIVYYQIPEPDNIKYSFSANDICYGDTIFLSGVDSQNVIQSWQWQIDTLSLNGQITFYKPLDSSQKTISLIVTDNSSCTDSDSAIINIFSLPDPTISGDSMLCEGEQIVLSLNDAKSYNWSPSNGLDNNTNSQVIAEPSINTRYHITITDQNSCTDTGSIMIIVFPIPAVQLGDDQTIDKGQSIILSASGGDSYTWSPLDGIEYINDSTVSVSPSITTSYKLIVNNNGCENEDEIIVSIMDYNVKIAIPKAFTPDGDGINDQIQVYTKGLKEYELLIFNRWGQVIFESKDANQAWDGTFNNIELEVETYTYIIRALSENNENILQKGQIQLIR